MNHDKVRCTEKIQIEEYRIGTRRSGASCQWCSWWHPLDVPEATNYTTQTGQAPWQSAGTRRLSDEELQEIHDAQLHHPLRVRRRSREQRIELPSHLRTDD
jgi:hypothetical protein